jgi:hypothetical protein
MLDDAVAFGLVFLGAVAVLFGLAAGAVRQHQGGSFGGGFAWGALLGLIGLIVVLATAPKERRPTAQTTSNGPLAAAPPPAPSIAPPPASSPVAASPVQHASPSPLSRGQMMRECPSCKEAMRRDASVCPHCRRDSEPWRFWEGRWWAYSASGDDVWYDEVFGVWRTPDATSPADRGGSTTLSSPQSRIQQRSAELLESWRRNLRSRTSSSTRICSTSLFWWSRGLAMRRLKGSVWPWSVTEPRSTSVHTQPRR